MTELNNCVCFGIIYSEIIFSMLSLVVRLEIQQSAYNIEVVQNN